MSGSGRYGNSGGGAHASGQMQRTLGQRMEHKSVNYYAFDKERPHVGASKSEGQWRCERDYSKASYPMSPHMLNEGLRGDALRSYYQDQRTDLKMGLEKQGNSDPLSQPRGGEDIDIYEDKPLSQTFEGLEKSFLDDIMKLSKEQSDAEDAENARHREKINAINIRYQEQLGALRARYVTRREEFLQKESQARQKQYQQVMMESSYNSSGMGPSEAHGYASEPRGTHNANQYDSYRGRARILATSTRDHGLGQGGYPGGRVYDTGSRYY